MCGKMQEQEQCTRIEGLVCLRWMFDVAYVQHAVVRATRSYIAHDPVRVHKLACRLHSLITVVLAMSI